MMKSLFIILAILCLGYTTVFAQSSMYSPFFISTNSCSGSTYTDYQYTPNAIDSYGYASPDVWYSFTLTSTTSVEISTCGSDFDTYLRLFSSSYTEINSDDDHGCGGATSSIYATLGPGTYIVAAEGYASYSGNLEISFNFSASGAPSAGSGMTYAIPAGTFSSSGTFSDTRSNADPCLGNNIGHSSNDIYYKFTLNGTADVTLMHCGSSIDTYMHLLDAYGTEINQNDDSSLGSCPGVQAYIQTTLSAGTYYVVSEGYSSYAGNITTSIQVSMGGSSGSPVITYSSPSSFSVGAAVNLSPVNTGGAVSSGGQSTITLAGSGNPGFSDGFGAAATFDYVINTAVDAAGNVYVADAGNHSIRKITPAGQVTTFAGRGYAGFADGTGTAAAFMRPAGFAIDASGNLFVSDQNNHRIRKITPAGVVTTFAGSGAAGSADGVGTAASFNNPIGLTFDASGNLFVADYTMHKIRKITPSGVVSTFAGTGAQGSTNGPALSATFNNPMGVVFDAAGNLFVADRYNFQVRKITPSGMVSTFAGNGVAGYQDGTGSGAQFRHVNSMVLDKSGNIYINDQTNNMIRKITPAGVVSTFAGTTTAGVVNGEGSVVRLSSPYGLSIDNNENIYIAEDNTNRIRKMTILKAYTISPALPAGLVFNNNDGTISGTPTAAAPLTTYTVTAYNGAGSNSTTLSFAVTAGGICLTPSQDQNYVISYTPREGGMTTAAAVIAGSCNPNLVQTSIQYIDGLGRPLQTVQVQGSPSFMDVVQPKVYDAFGRESRKYLPYGAEEGSGGYKADALTKQLAYYSSSSWDGHIAKTTKPFSEAIFEASPLNRVLELGAPGTVWQPAASRSYTEGRTVLNEYGTNNANEVKMWTVSSSGANSGFYDVGKLMKVTIKDENWTTVDGKVGTIDEFKDVEGKVVLKQVWETTTKSLSTYYVYDNAGNLRYVLPPAVNEGTDRLGGAINNFTETDDAFKNYIYGYHYDNRRRLIEKKIPGKDWEYMVYNVLDQLVMTQDGKQRANGRWKFTKYDAFGRKIMTGQVIDISIRSSVQASIDAHGASNGSLWENRESNNGTDYTNTALPNIAIEMLYAVNYYDNYNFRGMDVIFPPHSAGVSHQTKGLLTGTRIYQTDGNASVWTLNYYDEDGRMQETIGQNHLGGTDRIINEYNFNNLIKSSSRTHIANGVTTQVVKGFIYDHMNRKISITENINNQGVVFLNRFTFNEIGQLKKKELHSVDNGLSYLHYSDYEYNERGWMKKMGSNEFSLQLNYNDADGVAPQFNGNISNQLWGHGRNTSNIFRYNYDRLNRLTNAVSIGLGESINYDVMGNITSLSRDGFGTNYYDIYEGNKLKHIYGFINSSYTHDENGNMIYDSGKNMNFSYNYLDLPSQVIGSSTLTYIYDSTGKKLRKQSAAGTIDYIDGIQYKPDGTIDIIHTDEGVVRNNAGGLYSYEYNLTDHLGNVRYTFNQNPVTGELAKIQADDYFAFGLRKIVNAGVNKYLYNGKEMQEESSQLDYGARFYDPEIARFNTIDPLAEVSRRWSTYNYAVNNPIRFIDVDGMYAEMPSFSASGNATEDYPDEVQYVVDKKDYATVLSSYGVELSDSGSQDKGGDDKKGKKKKVQTGSYTITFENGKRYHGKGSYDRALRSAKRIGKKYDKATKKIDWTPSENDREAFKDEDTRLENDGGPKNDENYNEIKSPGAKYKLEDAKAQVTNMVNKYKSEEPDAGKNIIQKTWYIPQIAPPPPGTATRITAIGATITIFALFFSLMGN